MFFSAGIMLARGGFEIRLFTKHRWFSILIWTLVSIVVYWGMVHYGVNHPDMRIMICYFVLAVFAWLGMLKWMEFGPTTMFVRYVTPASFFIYCAHFLVCSTFLHLIAGKVPDSAIKLMLLYGVFLGVGGITLIVVFHVARRYYPKTLAVFTGGRLS